MDVAQVARAVNHRSSSASKVLCQVLPRVPSPRSNKRRHQHPLGHVLLKTKGNQRLADVGVVARELIKDERERVLADDETLERVYYLNETYNKVVEDEEEVRRNINWKLKSLKWDNLFNYGEGNSINFENLAGIIGIFGKNFSGKSSIIDSLLYTVYN